MNKRIASAFVVLCTFAAGVFAENVTETLQLEGDASETNSVEASDALAPASAENVPGAVSNEDSAQVFVSTTETVATTEIISTTETVAVAENDAKEQNVVLEGSQTPQTAQIAQSVNADVKSSAENFKKSYLGISAAVTYNDFYGSDFGFNDIETRNQEYSVEVSGEDGLMGNYWGVGFNAGIGVLYMFCPVLGVRADLQLAYRRGNGKSDFDVFLKWNDSSKMTERSHVQVEYEFNQINLDIPVVARMLFAKTFFVDYGPMASLNFRSKVKTTLDDGSKKLTNSVDDFCNRFEMDAVVGLGLMRQIGGSYIETSARFVAGLTPLNDDGDSPKTLQGQFLVTMWIL